MEPTPASSPLPERIAYRLYDWFSQLRAQAVLLTILLMLLMTILTVGVIYLAYQQVAQFLAESRDHELALRAASDLSIRMNFLAGGLSTLADQIEMQSGEPTLQEIVLERGRTLTRNFTSDGGVVILDANGYVSVTRPFRPDLIGQDLSREPYFQEARDLRRIVFSGAIVREPHTNQDIIVIAVPIINRYTGEFVGVIAGRFYVSFQRFGGILQKARVGQRGTTYLVDRTGRLIYHPATPLIGANFSHRTAVKRLQQEPGGGGALTGQEIDQPWAVEGYAVVPGAGWGLVVTEPWTQVIAPARQALSPVTITVIIGLVIVATVVSIGVQRVTDPIQDLVIQTRQVTRGGDYTAQAPLSHLKEIKELEIAFNEMFEQMRRYRTGVQQYVADITRTQEEERRRIARELHDDTIQSLIAIGQRIELLKTMLDEPEEARIRLSDVRGMVTSTITNVRQFSRDLRPLTLEDLGLVAAMQHLVNHLAQQEAITVHFEVKGETEGLSNDMEVAIYRILQEALSNVKKHAQATTVTVSAEFTRKQIVMCVEDNGRGFEVPESMTDFASNGNFGMMGLQERAQLFDGSVVVQSEPGQGTIVRMVMPRQPSPFHIRIAPLNN
jgi:signal transduction histidine kinase